MIRNIAIIAHVDHGKTTLVDEMLKTSEKKDTHETIDSRTMDSLDLEKERGITILAKNTAIQYQGVKINILDTPGHADFGGEVERIMKMVDAVCLVVDAYEGVMPQTRFVLSKALKEGLKSIVVINKMDRMFVRPKEVIDEVYELFLELGATEEQLDFPIVYASGILGKSSIDTSLTEDMKPLLDKIIEYVPAPKGNKDNPLQFQPALLDYNEYVGRIGIGKVYEGTIKLNQTVSVVRLDGSIENFRVQRLSTFMGLERVDVKQAYAGDIISVSGLADIQVGETINELNQINPLEPLHIEKPTVKMTFLTNSSPFSGKEGKHVTSSKVEARLFLESQKDVSLLIEKGQDSDSWIVSGRGELHLGILIETMRREGYEFMVSRPDVILLDKDNIIHEPYEYVTIDVPNDFLGNVIELFGSRRAVLIDMHSHQTQTKITYHMPSKGLIGIQTIFLSLTQGYGVLSHTFLDYRPEDKSAPIKRKTGALVSINEGFSTAYAISHLESRGALFIEPRVEVYEGMIVGEASKDDDLAVNITQEKQLTNIRSATKDSTVVLKRPKEMSLENCMAFINADELIEITPKSIRLRKKILNTGQRKKYDKYN